MKKVGALLLTVLLIFMTFSLVFAQTNNSTSSTTTSSSSTTTSNNNEGSVSNSVSSSSTGDTGTLGDLSKAYSCLEEKAGTNCQNINSPSELSFIILSGADGLISGCVDKLVSLENNNNYGSIRDTALAVIALNHVGRDTSLLEKWLFEKRINPTDINWYLQQDSDGAVECNIDDGDLRFEIEIDENKKISSDAGQCLRRAQSNFWYQIDPSCYSKQFTISCDQDFITNLLYKNRKASTIYVLEDTKQSPAFGTTDHTINSKCLGTGSTCDYEGTAWATVALQKTGNNVDEFIPYLIATADLKEIYLPNAFIYLITSYDDYGTKLIQEQRFGSYWEAENSAYNRYYDTSLALISLGLSQEQSIRAKEWLLFEQGTNGCWGNSVRETSFILWGLLQKEYQTSTVYCEDAGFYCVEAGECSDGNNIGDNYFCSGSGSSFSVTCCKEEPELETCSEMGGTVCPTGQVCQGVTTNDLYGQACCLAGCSEPAPQLTACEDAYYSCFSECGENYESVSELSCNYGEVCCNYVAPAESDGLPWWVWLLIILILLALIGIVGFFVKKKLDEKKGNSPNSKDKKDDSPNSNNTGGLPPPRGPPGSRMNGPIVRRPIRGRPMGRRPLRRRPVPPQGRPSIAS